MCDDDFDDADIARDEEVFAPVWPIIGFDTLEEALEIANNTPFGLSSGVITENMRTAIKTATGVQAGACIINGTGSPTSPSAVTSTPVSAGRARSARWRR